MTCCFINQSKYSTTLAMHHVTCLLAFFLFRYVYKIHYRNNWIIAAQRVKQQFIILTYDIVFGGKISIHLTALDCPIIPHCLTRFATRILCGIWLHNHMFSSKPFFPLGDRSGVCEGYKSIMYSTTSAATSTILRSLTMKRKF